MLLVQAKLVRLAAAYQAQQASPPLLALALEPLAQALAVAPLVPGPLQLLAPGAPAPALLPARALGQVVHVPLQLVVLQPVAVAAAHCLRLQYDRNVLQARHGSNVSILGGARLSQPIAATNQ